MGRYGLAWMRRARSLCVAQALQAQVAS